MTLADVENLWSVVPSTLSKSDRGHVYFERFKLVAHEIRTNPDLRFTVWVGGKVSRGYLVERLGCGTSSLNQNGRIRNGLLDLEADLNAANPSEGSACRPSVASGANPWEEARRRRDARTVAIASTGKIVLTNEFCRVGGRARPGIPTVLWPDGIDENVSDWLRYLVCDRGVSTGTAKEYAKILRLFGSYYRRSRIAWSAVNDGVLRKWMEELEKHGSGASRINTCVQTVFRFYMWAETRKLLYFHVGIYDPKDLPVELASSVFPIAGEKVFQKRGRHVIAGWRSPLGLVTHSRSEGKRNTPTEVQIREIHTAAMDQAEGERNCLMLSWAEETGARRCEFLQVKVLDLPTPDQLQDLIDHDQPWGVDVHRKGGRMGKLIPPSDLLLRTWDYVNGARAEIVERQTALRQGYIEPKEIFISSTTGAVLHPDTITRIGRQLFQKAGVTKANVHRLRARYVVRVIETLLDAMFNGQVDIGVNSSWVETILLKASEQMGHIHPSSLRPYLNYVLQRRIRQSDAVQLENKEAKLRQLALREIIAAKKVAQHGSLAKVSQLLRDGCYSEAAAGLRALAKDIEKSDR